MLAGLIVKLSLSHTHTHTDKALMCVCVSALGPDCITLLCNEASICVATKSTKRPESAEWKRSLCEYFMVTHTNTLTHTRTAKRQKTNSS